MGKAYANKKTIGKRPKGDFYETPKSLVWVASEIIHSEFSAESPILEPCCGNGAISNELKKMEYKVVENDLHSHIGTNYDYLDSSFPEEYVITNPPFSLWDEFVLKAKTHCQKIMFIGRLNYFGTNSRLKNGMWDNLKSVHCFNRYVDYRTEGRIDGLFNVGAMATAWFLWDMNYNDDPTIHFLDVQKYAKLGNCKDQH